MQVDFKSWNKPQLVFRHKIKATFKGVAENWELILRWNNLLSALLLVLCIKNHRRRRDRGKTAISSRFWKRRSFEAKTAISSHFWKRASFPLIRVEKKTPSFCRKAFLKIIHVSMWKKETHVVKCKSENRFCFY